jgi:uncharacterized protein
MSEPTASLSKCPICGRDTVPDVRPFCSRRCADVDLGRWFSGQYRTPSLRIDPDEDDQDRLPPA